MIFDPRNTVMEKIFRAPDAHFIEDTKNIDDIYNEARLESLVSLGFNGIWVRLVFRRLLKNPNYPEFGDQAEDLDKINNVIAMAAKQKIKVYAYIQEPLGLPEKDEFWKKHPNMGGATYKHQDPFTYKPERMKAMCVSSPEVRKYLKESSAQLLTALPGLGGIITITASEFISHCYSKYYIKTQSHHGDSKSAPLRCVRCAKRKPAEIVVEILNNLREGMDVVDTRTPLLAWNWSWHMYEDDPQSELIGKLLPGIVLLIDFERGGEKTNGSNKNTIVEEYSLSYAGPSERFLKSYKLCGEKGKKIYAKLQIGTTHEIATVANLPLIGNLYEKAKAMKDLKIDGFLGCWNFGLEPSLNLRAFNYFLSNECSPDKTTAMRDLALLEFPQTEPSLIISAWDFFEKAFDLYPFSVSFLYFSPINYSLILPFTQDPLSGNKMGRSWVMDDRGDDLAQSCNPFSATEIIERLTQMCLIWERGLSIFETALKANSSKSLFEEVHTIWAIYLSLRSCCNFHKLYLLKKESPHVKASEFRELIKDELKVVTEAIPVYSADSRQGFHQECSEYMITVKALTDKKRTLEGMVNA